MSTLDVSRPDTVMSHYNLSENEKDLATKPVAPSRPISAIGSDDQTIVNDPNTGTSDGKHYLTGWKLFLVFVGLLMSVFLFALDQTIVATAQPKIVSHFNALEKIAWVTSAYFLTQAGFILTMGQIMTITSTKAVYITAISLFEFGSLLCAVAPSINFLIFGRAVAGVGAAGIFSSVLAIIAEVTRLEDRPLLFGSFGGVFAISSTVGPLLGGAFTDKLSWRWCFYINLPFGALAIASVFFFLHTEGGAKLEKLKNLTPLQRWLSLDFVGTALILGFVTSLLLALQWGGNTKPWSSGDVIACLVLAVVLIAVFGVWEWKQGDKAMLPIGLLNRRTQVGTMFGAFFIFLGLLLGTYYLPIFYQARGASASKSGVDILAFMLAVVVSAGVSSGVINKTGRYWPFIFFAPLFSAVGAGLLFTIKSDTSNAKLIGYQILFGIGIGGAMQNIIIATQTEYALEEELIPQGTSATTFGQLLGGVIGVTVGSAVFSNQLATGLAKLGGSLTPDQIHSVRSSVTAIFSLPAALQPQVIAVYEHSLSRVFIIGVPTSFLASVAALLIKNYNIKERSPTAGGKHSGFA